MDAKAALISINLETHNVVCSFFDNGNPCKDAWDFWEGIKRDWPEHCVTVLGNDDACEAYRAYRTETLLRNLDLATLQTPEP